MEKYTDGITIKSTAKGYLFLILYDFILYDKGVEEGHSVVEQRLGISIGRLGSIKDTRYRRIDDLCHLEGFALVRSRFVIS